jgi:maleate isomerase
VMRRIGVLTPSSNTVVEPLTMSLTAPLADRLSLHYARFRVTVIADEPQSDEQFALAPIIDAARLLADARVDAILWAGTSGAWLGVEEDRRLVREIRRETRIPATTATLSLLDAFASLGVRRYGLVVPYVEQVSAAIVRNMAAAGFECIARTSEGITDNWAFSAMPAALIAERIHEVARARPDAVAVLCTNLRGAQVAEALETELALPVLDSVVVGLWGVLGLVGLEPPSRGFGRLADAGLIHAQPTEVRPTEPLHTDARQGAAPPVDAPRAAATIDGA